MGMDPCGSAVDHHQPLDWMLVLALLAVGPSPGSSQGREDTSFSFLVLGYQVDNPAEVKVATGDITAGVSAAQT